MLVRPHPHSARLTQPCCDFYKMNKNKIDQRNFNQDQKKSPTIVSDQDPKKVQPRPKNIYYDLLRPKMFRLRQN
jgi:hypothetical protein